MTLAAVDLSPAQVNAVKEAKARVNVWDGSIRSGKTVSSLLAFLLAVVRCPAGGEIVIIGRTRDTVARNLFGPLKDTSLFGIVSQQIHYNAGAPTAKILGRTVHVLGASDARAEAILRGLTVALAYVDEATLISEPFWTQLLGRMSVRGARLFATTNPDGPSHWFKREVIDRADELGYARFKFTIDDNPFLDPAYVAQIKREFRGLWYRRFILGEWVQAAGAVYDTWDEARHVVPHDSLPPMDRVLALGIDHGTTNPTRGLLVGVGQQRLWVIDEWAPATGLTDSVQSAYLRGWMAAHQYEPEWVFVDPAAASFRAQLFNDGLVPAPAHNAVLPGIRTVSSLLATDRLAVSERCTNLIKFLPGYVWDPKKTAKGEDAPIKVDDHEVDALRYGVHSSRAFWRDAVPLLTAAPGAPGTDETLEVAA